MSDFNLRQDELYNGPDFEEYCISEGRYLPARRDRTPCTPCPLSNLCQAGFEEQVRRVIAGQDPSLTSVCSIPPTALVPENLLSGLTTEQAQFVLEKIPGLRPKEMANG